MTIGMKRGGMLLTPGRRTRWKNKGLLAAGALLCAVGIYWGVARFQPFQKAYPFEIEIKKIPLYAVIAEHHPELFQHFVKQATQGIREGHAQHVARYSTLLVNQVFYPSLQKASSLAVMTYVGALVQLYHYLSLRHPEVVLGLEYGRPIGRNNLENDPHYQQLLMLLLEAKKQVIVEAVKAPLRTPSVEEGAPLLQALLETLSQKWGENVVRAFFSPGQTGLPDQVLASVAVAFYAHIGASGEEKAAIMMRHLAALRAPIAQRDPEKEAVPSPSH